MWKRLLQSGPIALSALLAACGAEDPAGIGDDSPFGPPPPEAGPCTYTNNVQPGQWDGEMFPYSWDRAYLGGIDVPLKIDLADAPCDTSDEYGWSPFDTLTFVVISSW